MIVLIGGVSSTGKTLMAKTLLESYKIPYFSIDYLKMGIYRSNPDCGFTPLDRNEVIAEKIWPILREMIKTYIENEQTIVIEGCYLLPRYIKELLDLYPDKIISSVLVFSTDYIRHRFRSHILAYREVAEKRGIEERPISQFINEHEDLKADCLSIGLDYDEISGDYERDIQLIYDRIGQSLDNNSM